MKPTDNTKSRRNLFGHLSMSGMDQELKRRLILFRIPIPTSSTGNKIERPPYQESDLQSTSDDSTIGSFDIANTNVGALAEEVVEPLFELRGMDIFLTDAAEEEMNTHPFLIKYVVSIG